MTPKPHLLLSVDPGKTLAGVAIFQGGVLVRCALVRADDPYRVAVGVGVWSDPYAPYDDLVVEGQQVYGGPRRSDPNDLLPLAQVVGGVQARVRAQNRHIILPGKWTGRVKKEIRCERTLAALRDSGEIAVLESVKIPASLLHNTLDAIAMGKWFLRSME